MVVVFVLYKFIFDASSYALRKYYDSCGCMQYSLSKSIPR